MQGSGEVRSQWNAVKDARDKVTAGTGTPDEVIAAMDAFFERHESRGQRRAQLATPTDVEVRELKAQLLEQLRTERIYVLERGAIENYYPAASQTDKPTQAQQFCDQHPDGDSIRALLGTGGPRGCVVETRSVRWAGLSQCAGCDMRRAHTDYDCVAVSKSAGWGKFWRCGVTK